MSRTVAFVVLAALSVALAGCGPCGLGFSGWDTPLSCRSDNIPQQK